MTGLVVALVVAVVSFGVPALLLWVEPTRRASRDADRALRRRERKRRRHLRQVIRTLKGVRP